MTALVRPVLKRLILYPHCLKGLSFVRLDIFPKIRDYIFQGCDVQVSPWTKILK